VPFFSRTVWIPEAIKADTKARKAKGRPRITLCLTPPFEEVLLPVVLIVAHSLIMPHRINGCWRLVDMPHFSSVGFPMF